MMEVNFKINIKQRIRRIICFTLIIFFAFLVRMERAQVYAVQNPGAGSQMAGTDNPGTTALPAAQQPIITQLTYGQDGQIDCKSYEGQPSQQRQNKNPLSTGISQPGRRTDGEALAA